MEELKSALVGQKRSCEIMAVVENPPAKIKTWAVDCKIAESPNAEEVGMPVKFMAFQLFEVGKSYPVDFSLGGKKKDALIGKRPQSTEEERELRRANEAKEKAEYEAEMAKSGGTGGPNGPAANLIPTERQGLLAKKYGFTAGDVMLMEQNGIVPRETPLTQVEFFFRTAELMKLNPLLKQVYLLPFGYGAKKGYAIVVAIDSMRRKAIETGQYGGKTKILFDGLSMAEWIRDYDNRREYEKRQIPRTNGQRTWNEDEYHLVKGDFPQTASVIVTRIIDGKPYQFEAEIAWDEYYPGPSGRGQMWRDRPFGQLGKCCEAIALRQAFADSLGKHYVSEELDRKAAQEEAVDIPHLDWDAILKEIQSCKTVDECMALKVRKPELANDGEFMATLQLRVDEINRDSVPTE
jgi:phage recombination protein Bet